MNNEISGYCDHCERPIKVGSMFYRNRAEGTMTCKACKKRQVAESRAAKQSAPSRAK